MRLVITGTPGAGKTTIAKALAKRLKLELINEKEFAKKKKIGRKERSSGELVVGLKKLEAELNKLLKRKKNVVIEGHLVSECKLRPVDAVIVVRLSPDRLEFRLQKRNYSEVKIQDNVLCEGIDYCLKKAKKCYSAEKVMEFSNDKELKHTIASIIRKIRKLPKD